MYYPYNNFAFNLVFVLIWYMLFDLIFMLIKKVNVIELIIVRIVYLLRAL